MKKVRTVIPVSRIQLNTGQIDWLPKNPRQWIQEDVNNQIASIEEDEDYLEDRPALVVRKDDKEYVVFAGNLRTFASKKMKLKGMPSVIYEPESDEDRETVIRRAAKDNGTYGKWDMDSLANEWSDLPLSDWGVSLPADWLKNSDEDLSVPGPAETPIRGAQNLPAELQGLDITPAELPKIQGTDETAMDRVIIVYPRNRINELAAVLRLPSIDKVVYQIDELLMK
mgnify:CR=1 FL=1